MEGGKRASRRINFSAVWRRSSALGTTVTPSPSSRGRAHFATWANAPVWCTPSFRKSVFEEENFILMTTVVRFLFFWFYPFSFIIYILVCCARFCRRHQTMVRFFFSSRSSLFVYFLFFFISRFREGVHAACKVEYRPICRSV